MCTNHCHRVFTQLQLANISISICFCTPRVPSSEIPCCRYHKAFEWSVVHFVCFWRDSPQWAMASSFTRFIDHTRRTAGGRTPLDKLSARRRDLYLTTHTTLTTDRHLCPQWDSNPQSQQASCR
jgi:hypothetical protein